jgi:hypothetical protein
MSDMYSTTSPADEGDADIPVLTDIINEDRVETTPEIPLVTVSDTAAAAAAAEAETEAQAATELINQRLRSLEHIETELSARLSAELALQIPVLLEAALREHLPKAIGAKLQAELISALANALPGAAQNAAAELSSTLAFEVGTLIEQRLEEDVRRAVSDEMARLSEDRQRLP